MTLQTLLATLAIVFAVAFLALGRIVTTRPATPFDLRVERLHGSYVRAAKVFTRSGRSLPLLALGVVSLLATLTLRKPVWIPLAIFTSQLLSQGAVELCKRLFARARPDDWLVRHERGFSYPSGHASTATVFYGSWLIALMFLPLETPLRYAVAALFVAWMIGIDWSRIALGAHYLTDVLGGTLFGLSWICALLAVFARLPQLHRV